MRHLISAVCVLAFAVSGCGVPRTSDGTVSPGSAGAPAPAAAPEAETKTATWGERYTWTDGLAVEVSAPVACKPGKYSIPQTIERGVKVTIKIINGGKEPFDTAVLGIGNDAQFAGAKAEEIFDSSGDCGGGAIAQSTTVLPGKSFDLKMAFAVSKQPGELQLALQPNFAAAKAIFVGQA
ncbi:MAG TPA: hypothetical protein VM677_27230 [Actinokineospora sp.]|nr:hypothetical protein [Actinokineospora sp.]